MIKALVAMSGGVDSSVCACILKEKGIQIKGVTLRLFNNNIRDFCCDENDILDAENVCKNLSVPFETADYSGEFEKYVINSFVAGYLRGETPNPCINCNRFIKFPCLFDIAQKENFSHIATGHYARIEKDSASGRYLLKKGAYDLKDQSYVLYNLRQNQLERIIFPIGEMNKQQVREIAEKYGFVNRNKPDSQDICFVGNNDYVSFIEKRMNRKFEAGNFVDRSGNVIAKHRGVISYTVGQRKGLGIASEEPYYVLEKDVEKNEVIIGRYKEQFTKSLNAGDLNFIPFDFPRTDMRCKAKIRYRHEPAEALIIPLDENRVKVEFLQEQKAVTRGQSVVFYEDEYVLGGGIIR